MTSHRQLARARLLANANLPGRFWDIKTAQPIAMWVWPATPWPDCLMEAASLLLDGYPARWPRPRRTPVAR